MIRWGSYLAMGDSFTEGVDDPHPAGHYRGWADRFAEHLANVRPDLRYANLAVRGKLLREIVDEQLPPALAARPELVTLAGGGNDLLRPNLRMDNLMTLYDRAVGQLRDACCEVVLFGTVDPGDLPLLRHLRARFARFNEGLDDIAARHECTVIELWRLPPLADVRAWSADRLHLSPEGHRRVALYVCSQLEVDVDDDWRTPWPPAQPAPWWSRRYDDARWTRDHLAPWIARRLRRRTSGVQWQAKRPQLQPL